MEKPPASCWDVDTDVRSRRKRIVQAASRANGAVKLQPLSCGRIGDSYHLPATYGVWTFLTCLLHQFGLVSKSHSADIEPGVTQGQLDAALEEEGGSHLF